MLRLAQRAEARSRDSAHAPGIINNNRQLLLVHTATALEYHAKSSYRLLEPRINIASVYIRHL